MGMVVPPRTDPLLAFILAVFNEIPGAGIGLTAMTDGGTVTGVAVPEDEWLRLVAEQMTASPALAGFTDYFTHQANELAAHRELNQAASELDEHEPLGAGTYLHLSQARFVGPGGLMPEPATMLLRIRLNTITGWSVGVLSRGDTT